jgi:murein biosynthesis integral membrane protein MurJ
MIPPAARLGFRFRPALDKKDPGYREVMGNFLPVILGVALFQFNLLLDQVIARLFIPEDGPVTILAYGNRLVQLPWALFSLSLATAVLPMLSRHWAKGEKTEFLVTAQTAVRHTLYLALPSAVVLGVCARDLVMLFYGTGEFLRDNAEAVERAGRVVVFFSAGLAFYSLNSVLARAVYATKDTRTPTRSALYAVGLNLLLNLVFVLGTGMKEAGLALASAISGAFQTLYLARALQRVSGERASPRLKGFALLYVVSVGAALLGTLLAYRICSRAPPGETEGVVSFFVMLACIVAPPWVASWWYFNNALRPLQQEGAEQGTLRYGVPDKQWPSDLTFYHSLLTITQVSLVVGLWVWAVRESLPPRGAALPLILQRALVPVAAGMFVFAIASETFHCREYAELKAALARRLFRKRRSADAP